jgi:hypothetical protein
MNINQLILLKHSFFIGPNIDTKYNIFDLKYNIYKLFCSNSQNIDILIYAFLSILLLYFTTKYIIRNKKIILSIIVETFSVYFCIYFFTNNPNFLFLSLTTPIIFITIYYFNLYLPLQKFVMLIPIIGETFCINNIVLFITNKKQKEIFALIISIIITSVIYIFTPYNNNKITNSETILKGNVYNINVDSQQDRFIISSSPVLLINNTNKKINEIKTNFDIYQDAVVNWKKEEVYIYSSEDGMLYIYDINTKKEKTKIKILDFDYIKKNMFGNDEFADYIFFARAICDSEQDLMLLAFERDLGSFLIDLKNLQIIQHYDTAFTNDTGIYNKFRNSFILTYFQTFKKIQEIALNTNSINSFFVGSEQGYIAISNQNKELYIAFHQQGRIGVYDAETLKFKRKIKTTYAVKDITYDEELNILIAPSYFTGYVDIFLMDGTDKLLTRKFVGYELREAKFDTKKENLYVCSMKGLYKIPINIKDLIKKYSNVSHETLN